MTVNQFFDWWRAHQQQQQAGDMQAPLYYLKDWHFVGEFPDYKAYELPKYFSEDWLNEWWLLPPEHTHLLLDQQGQLPSDFFQAAHLQSDNGNSSCHSRAQEHLIELVQGGLKLRSRAEGAGAGSHVFSVTYNIWLLRLGSLQVPAPPVHPGFTVQLDTLSINHNWINAHNVHWSWALLQHEHCQATELLEDCREAATPAEFEELVQKMLAANSGFSFEDFARFLSTIIKRAATVLQQVQQAAIAAAKYNAEHAAKQLNSRAISQPFMRMGQQSKSRYYAEDVPVRSSDQPAEAALTSYMELLPNWVQPADVLVTQVQGVLGGLGLR
eukprot:gene1673-2016_t